MTHAKKLKREIRARALTTGESYTAARRHILLAREKREAPPPVPSAARPGIADGRVVKATGRGLEHWYKVLDGFGALAKGHTVSAAHLLKDHGLPGWWAQMVTGAYERARGKRVKNQTCDGDFQVGVSRAINVGVDKVVAALSDRQWLRDVDPELLRAYPEPAKVRIKNGDYATLRYRWGASAILITVSARKGGSTVVADNTKLAGTAEVERRRKQWREALDALRAFLTK
ncbi:MAG TPA: hypothetical protein VFC90_07535 [Planctomycetota bacterium]|nr:hypothetical protein [Planctomycetota bacterium]